MAMLPNGLQKFVRPGFAVAARAALTAFATGPVSAALATQVAFTACGKVLPGTIGAKFAGSGPAFIGMAAKYGTMTKNSQKNFQSQWILSLFTGTVSPRFGKMPSDHVYRGKESWHDPRETLCEASQDIRCRRRRRMDHGRHGYCHGYPSRNGLCNRFCRRNDRKPFWRKASFRREHGNRTCPLCRQAAPRGEKMPAEENDILQKA